MYYGVWRRHPGAEIYEDSFDANTGEIGEYKIPLNFAQMNLEEGNSSPSKYTLYRMLNASSMMLACISVTSKVYIHVYATFCEIQDIDSRQVSTYPYVDIRKHIYVPIGYVQTVQKCIAVYQYPYYLLMDKNTHEVVGYPGLMLPNVSGVFPMSIFRALADSDNDAVWRDTSDRIHFIKEGVIVP